MNGKSESGTILFGVVVLPGHVNNPISNHCISDSLACNGCWKFNSSNRFLLFGVIGKLSSLIRRCLAKCSKSPTIFLVMSSQTSLRAFLSETSLSTSANDSAYFQCVHETVFARLFDHIVGSIHIRLRCRSLYRSLARST